MFESLFRTIGILPMGNDTRLESHDLDGPRAHFSSLKSSFDEANIDLEAPRPANPSPEPASKANSAETQVVFKSSRKEKLCMVTCAVASLIVALDATILAPVLPTLAVDLHGSASDAFVSTTHQSIILAHLPRQRFQFDPLTNPR